MEESDLGPLLGAVGCSFPQRSGSVFRVEGVEDTATEKISRMRAAGISVAERIEEIPDLIRERLADREST